MSGVRLLELLHGMMTKMFFPSWFVLLCCVSFASVINAGSAREGYLRTTVEDGETNKVYWDYSDGPFGPAHWSELMPSWKLCSAGKYQSPINIDTANLEYDDDLDAPAIHDYVDTEAYVVNTGHSVQVLWPAGTLFVEGKNYSLTHFEFHTPSEHTIDGKSLPLEMQLVHENEDGERAIVVVLSDYGPTNWWVDPMWQIIPPLDFVGEARPVGIMSPDGFRVNFSKYYRYSGSLTTPNCEENVVWTILSTVYEISEEQIVHLRSVLPSLNNRPLQPLGKRAVSFPKASV